MFYHFSVYSCLPEALHHRNKLQEKWTPSQNKFQSILYIMLHKKEFNMALKKALMGEKISHDDVKETRVWYQEQDIKIPQDVVNWFLRTAQPLKQSLTLVTLLVIN
jgi:hypothetical protein